MSVCAPEINSGIDIFVAQPHRSIYHRYMRFVATSFQPVILLLALGVTLSANRTLAQDANEIAALKAEVERLKGLVPDQAHAMKDVGYHFANLWFAGSQTNWPLADFYVNETRSHLRWAVRIIPVRKDPRGLELRLADMLDPIEKSSWQHLHDAIAAHDSSRFDSTYREMMNSCYGCHVAVGKPFLRLRIPTQPEAPVIDFSPAH